MAAKISAESFLACVRSSGLIPADRLERLISESTDSSESTTLAQNLVQRGALTKWQADKLLQGRHKGFFLGKYRLLSLLGKGGMSAVYLAEHTLMRRRCAIKVLPAKRVRDSSYLGRFHREAQAVASLDHPNIVRAYDVDHETDGDTELHFLVMEYAEGRSLHEVVQQDGVLTFAAAADCIRQAADGLQHAHQAGLVHRDIKPGNLLLDRNGVIRILDLGLARFFGDEDETSLTVAHDERVLGTADYLAPEQALDSHRVDARADIYSLGCTMYFLLTGAPPFTEGTLAQRLLAHQTKTPPALATRRPDVPPSLAAIVNKMMSKRADDRHPTAAAVSEAMAQWLTENAPTGRSQLTVGSSTMMIEPMKVGVGSDVKGAKSGLINGRSDRTKTDFGTDQTPSGSQAAEELKNSSQVLNEEPSGGAGTAGSSAASPGPTPINAEEQEAELANFLRGLSGPKPAAAAPASGPAAGPVAGQAAGPKSDVPLAKPVAKRPRPKQPAAAPPAKPQMQNPVAAAAAFAANAAPAPNVAEEDPGFNFTPDAGGSAPYVISSDVAGSGITRSSIRSSVITRDKSGFKDRLTTWVAGHRGPAIGGGIALLAAVIGIFFWLSGGDQTVPEQAPIQANGNADAVEEPAPTRNLIGQEIQVGPGKDFKTLTAALDYVKANFSNDDRSQVQVIRAASGETFRETLQLDNRSGFAIPYGIQIVTDPAKPAVLAPPGGNAVIQLYDAEGVLIEGFLVQAKGHSAAVEISGYSSKLTLKNLTLEGADDAAVIGRGMRGAGGQDRVLFDGLTVRNMPATAVGIQLTSGDQTTYGEFRNSRFLGPMKAGIAVDEATRDVSINHNIFANLSRGIQLASDEFRTLRITYNTFYQADEGIALTTTPGSSSSGLQIRRNLFVETEPEFATSGKLETAAVTKMTSGGGVGENITSGKGEIQAPKLFSSDDQREANVSFTSTDPASPDFLQPAAGSRAAKVGSGENSYAGAIAPGS